MILSICLPKYLSICHILSPFERLRESSIGILERGQILVNVTRGKTMKCINCKFLERDSNNPIQGFCFDVMISDVTREVQCSYFVQKIDLTTENEI